MTVTSRKQVCPGGITIGVGVTIGREDIACVVVAVLIGDAAPSVLVLSIMASNFSPLSSSKL